MQIEKLVKEIEEISATYAKNFKIKRDDNWYVLKLQEELGELIQSYLMLIGQGRAKGKTNKEIRADFQKEIADVFCHILLLAKHYDVDLEQEVNNKWLVYKKKQMA